LRVLFVNDYYFSTTGSSIANRNLCRALKRKGVDVAVLTCVNAHSSPAQDSTKVYYFPSLVSCYPVQIALPIIHRVRRILSVEKPDIIHLQFPSPLSYVTSWLGKNRGIPLLAGIHDLPRNISVFVPFCRSGVTDLARRLLINWFNSIDDLVSPSEYGKVFYKTLGVSSDIHVISNGVDHSLFHHDAEMAKAFKEKFLAYTNPHKSKVLYVGRISPEKDLEVLLEAFNYLKEEEIYLVMAGEVQSRGYYEKLRRIAGGDNIIFTGGLPLSFLIGAYSACSALIQPSTTELQGLTILEAMSCGMPIIGVDYGPISEMVCNGKNGMLFRPFDAKDCADKVRLFIQSSHEAKIEMSAQSLVSAQQQHSLEDTALMHIDLYCGLVAKRKSTLARLGT
jgi:1,2-diacylglycerol 3-alpha-glucosyltransferase